MICILVLNVSFIQSEAVSTGRGNPRFLVFAGYIKNICRTRGYWSKYHNAKIHTEYVLIYFLLQHALCDVENLPYNLVLRSKCLIPASESPRKALGRNYLLAKHVRLARWKNGHSIQYRRNKTRRSQKYVSFINFYRNNTIGSRIRTIFYFRSQKTKERYISLSFIVFLLLESPQ